MSEGYQLLGKFQESFTNKTTKILSQLTKRVYTYTGGKESLFIETRMMCRKHMLMGFNHLLKMSWRGTTPPPCPYK